MNEKDKAASDEKQKPSGVRQFIIMVIVLTIAAVVCAAFIFSEISRIDTSALESRKIPMPAPANSKTEEAKPVAAPAASPAK